MMLPQPCPQCGSKNTWRTTETTTKTKLVRWVVFEEKSCEHVKRRYMECSDCGHKWGDA